METVLIMLMTLILTGGGLATGFYLGKKQQSKPLTEEEEIKLRREKEEKQWQELFNYSERIAIRGYDDER